MTGRERVLKAINHEEPDRVPLDLGAMAVSGMHVNIVTALRQALGLDVPGDRVKVIEPYQLLGEIGVDLIEALQIDAVGVLPPRTMFGFANDNWKEWTTFQGVDVLVPGGFNTEPEPNGDLLLYPEGDNSVGPSGRMPADGWFFDSLIRQGPIDDETLNVDDNVEEFVPLSDADLQHCRREAERLRSRTDCAIVGLVPGTAFGDIAQVPAPWLKHPKGIRDIEEWYISTVTRQDYVLEVFERQCEVGLANLARLYEAVGDNLDVLYITGTDFGTQNGPFVSRDNYRNLFMPFHKRINDWAHASTPWKTLIHSCGSVRMLLGDFIEAGFDVLNPVQCSAACMGPAELKAEFGDRITFWGGGVDTQHTLPFGTPDEVRDQVRQRLATFGPGGGFVFNTIHNVQAATPVENVLAMYETVREHGRYPVS